MPIYPVDERPNYHQLQSCLTCPEVIDIGKHQVILQCGKYREWACEENFICNSHPQAEGPKEVKYETVYEAPPGYTLKKRKPYKRKKATASKQKKNVFRLKDPQGNVIA